MALFNLSPTPVKPTSASGTVLKGGTKSSTNNFLSMESILGNYSLDAFPYGSTVVQTGDVEKSLDSESSVFAFDNDRPLVKGVTFVINNDSLDHELRTTGTRDTNLRTNIHHIRYMKTVLAASAIRDGKFDVYTGQYEATYPQMSNDDFGSDFAATVSRANPGKLTMLVNKLPVSQTYETKNG